MSFKYVYTCCGYSFLSYRDATIHIKGSHFFYLQDVGVTVVYFRQDPVCRTLAQQVGFLQRKFSNYRAAINHLKEHFNGRVQRRLELEMQTNGKLHQ